LRATRVSGAAPDDLCEGRAVPPASAAASADTAIAAAASSSIAKMTVSVRDLPLRVHVTAGWCRCGQRPVAVFWTVGEVVDRLPGSDLEALLTTGAGEIVATAWPHRARDNERAAVAVMPSQSVEPGDYVVRVRSSQSPGGTETRCRCRSRCRPLLNPPAPSSSTAAR
jgi:hypothetical protein